MELQSYLRRQQGQILIEVLILCSVMSGVLFIFVQLAELQRDQRQKFYLSQPARTENADKKP